MIMIFILFVFANRLEADSIPTLRVVYDQVGRPLVQVDIGETYSNLFLLDTAANRPIIPTKSLVNSGQQVLKKAYLKHASSSGKMKTPVAWVPDLRLSGLSRGAFYSGVNRNNTTPQGLIGMDFLKGYVVRFSPEKSQLVLYPSNKAFSGAEWLSVDGTYTPSRTIMIETSYRGVQLDVLFATGNSRSVLSWEAYNEIKEATDHRLVGDDVCVREVCPQGLFENLKNAKTVTLKDFKIETFELGDIDVVYKHLSTTDYLGYREARLLILGADILRKIDFAIDTRNSDILLNTSAN